MANQALISWFRGGFAERLEAVSQAEVELTETTQRAASAGDVTDFSVLQAIRGSATDAARKLLAASELALGWLAENRAPVPTIQDHARDAMSSFRSAALMLVQMGEDVAAMTPERGAEAAAAIAEARSKLYDLTATFGVEVQR